MSRTAAVILIEPTAILNESRRTVNQLTDLFWSALHGLQSSTLAEATQLLTEHSVANGIGAQVAAQDVPGWVAGLRDLARLMRRRSERPRGCAGCHAFAAT